MEDYKKLSKQPLKFVLAEFRFSPVMQISKFIPDIQEALRKKYPIIDQKSSQSFQVQAGGIGVSSIERWSFVTGDKTSAVEINQERLIYCTTSYDRFNGFEDACRQVLNVLADIVEPGLILQVGLRYSDLITVSENEDISNLVDPHLAFPAYIAELGKGLHQRSETVINTELGALAIRTLYGEHNLTYLPDIQGLPISIEKEDTPSERLILDFDNFWQAKDEAVSFEVKEILNKLTKMHDISRSAFWKITSDYARNKKWN